MTLFGYLNLALILLIIVVTVRVRYVTKNEAVRKAVLEKRRAMNGDAGYNLYSKVYTSQTVNWLAVVSVGQVLYAISQFIQINQGKESLPALAIGFISLVLTLLGLFKLTKIIKS